MDTKGVVGIAAAVGLLLVLVKLSGGSAHGGGYYSATFTISNEEDGQPVAGAVASIDGAQAVSDAAGVARFEKVQLQAGKHTLAVSGDEFERWEKVVTL